MQLLEPLTGQDRTLDEISAGASATLVMFICNHCPFVKLLKGMVLLGTAPRISKCSLTYSGWLRQLEAEIMCAERNR